MNSRLLLLLFICISLNTYDQININIQPSRTSGVAPLYVFFDVRESTGLTDNDYLNANFSWDFDDPTGRYNETKGFVTAHMFEYSGEYTVTVNATDKNGNTVTETVVISVEEFSGTTYCFSTSGNDDDNPGIVENPFQSVT